MSDTFYQVYYKDETVSNDLNRTELREILLDWLRANRTTLDDKHIVGVYITINEHQVPMVMRTYNPEENVYTVHFILEEIMVESFTFRINPDQ